LRDYEFLQKTYLKITINDSLEIRVNRAVFFNQRLIRYIS